MAVMSLASARVTGAFQCPMPKIKIVPRTKPKIDSTIFSPSVISLNWRIFSPPIYHQRCGYLAYYLPHHLAYYFLSLYVMKIVNARGACLLPPGFIFLYYQKSFSDISLISAVRFLRYGHLYKIHHERRTEIISTESLFRFQSQFLHQFIACVGNIIVHHI